MASEESEALAPSLAAAVDMLTAEEQRIAMQTFAAHQVDRLAAYTSAAFDQMATLSAWLVSTLVAMNAAGLAYVIEKADSLHSPAWPAGAFLLGAALAMLNAVIIQAMQLRALPAIEMVSAYWRGIQIIGEYDTDDEERVMAPFRRMMRHAWIGPACGWLSAVVFLAGAISFGSQTLLGKPSSNENTETQDNTSDRGGQGARPSENGSGGGT